MDEHDKLSRFEMARPRLLGLAYRLLGSWADAEDAIQDTFLRWQGVDADDIVNPDAWLTTACTNRCLDILKSAARKRIDYVGPWLPEPLQTQTVDSPEDQHELASTLTTAFLLLLERLSPKERAAYILREIFECPYQQVAETLRLSQPACRQLVSRAARAIGTDTARYVPNAERQDELLSAFQVAISSGSTTALSMLLSEDIELHTDGGGKVQAARKVIYGKQKVEKFVLKVLCQYWPKCELKAAEINGTQGLVVIDNQTIAAVMTVDFRNDGKTQKIFIMRNPEKLRHFAMLAQHDASSGELRPN